MEYRISDIMILSDFVDHDFRFGISIHELPYDFNTLSNTFSRLSLCDIAIFVPLMAQLTDDTYRYCGGIESKVHSN